MEEHQADAGAPRFREAVPPSLKSGEEPIRDDDGVPRGHLLGFWRWAYSQTLDNTLRGVLAEYLVGLALGIVDGQTRVEWDPVDLTTDDGIRVEVKSSARLQSWAQKKPNRLAFGIPETTAWSNETGGWSDGRIRQSDVYVFCAFTSLDPDTADPLDTRQWEFYVVAAPRLTSAVGSQKSISLTALLKKVNPVRTGFNDLAEAVRYAAETA